MLALFGENGPFSLPHGKTDPVHNQYGWNAFANIMYVDQPPGTGFSYTTNPVRMSVCVCVVMLFWLIITKSTNIFVGGASLAWPTLFLLAFYQADVIGRLFLSTDDISCENAGKNRVDHARLTPPTKILVLQTFVGCQFCKFVNDCRFAKINANFQ